MDSLTVKDFLHFEQTNRHTFLLNKADRALNAPELRILRVHKMNKEHNGQKRVLGKLNSQGRNNFLSEPVVSMPVRWQWISTVRNVWVASVDPVSGFAVIRHLDLVLVNARR